MTETDFDSITRDISACGFKGKALLTYHNNKLINLDLAVSKRGSIVYGYFQTVSKLISASLRRKVSYKVIIEKLSEVYSFDPSGFSDLNKGKPIDSFAEYIIILLENYYKYPRNNESKPLKK